MKVFVVAAGVVALFTVPGRATPAVAQSQDQRPSYAGRWTYNDSLSDHPRDQLSADSSDGQRRSRRGGGGGGGGGGRGGRGGFGGGRGGFGGEGGGGSMDPAQRVAMRFTMELVTGASVVMDIAQGDTALTFAADGGAPLVLPVSGHKVKQPLDDETNVEIKGKWQGYHFIVERKVSNNGGTITEEYLKSTDGKQLYVIVKVEGLRGRTIQFRRIYDATPPG